MVFMRKIFELYIPLLGLGLAVFLPVRLWKLGRLDSLHSAFTLGSSIVIAVFTIALWGATQAMRELQEALVNEEMSPRLGIALLANQNVGGKKEEAALELQNIGRTGLVIVSAKEQGSRGALLKRLVRNEGLSGSPLEPVGEAPLALVPAASTLLWLENLRGAAKTKTYEIIIRSRNIRRKIDITISTKSELNRARVYTIDNIEEKAIT